MPTSETRRPREALTTFADKPSPDNMYLSSDQLDAYFMAFAHIPDPERRAHRAAKAYAGIPEGKGCENNLIYTRAFKKFRELFGLREGPVMHFEPIVRTSMSNGTPFEASEEYYDDVIIPQSLLPGQPNIQEKPTKYLREPRSPDAVPRRLLADERSIYSPEVKSAVDVQFAGPNHVVVIIPAGYTITIRTRS